MDIKKIVRKILLEQEGEDPLAQFSKAQRQLFERLLANWRKELPELTDELGVQIFVEYRRVLPLIKGIEQPAVASFLLRGQGKYTLNDLKDGSKVSIKDLLLFLIEFSNFRVDTGEPAESEEEQKEKRLNDIFNKNGAKPSEEKIETSKSLWDGQDNLVINEGDLRVYEINTRNNAMRYGYYYQEKLRELVSYNVRNDRHPKSVTPWCVASRGDEQRIMEDGRMIINPIGNMYLNYRTRTGGNAYYFYFVIDESKDLFGPRGEYYISTIIANDNGEYLIASMYNGERRVSWNEILSIYPQLKDHQDVFQFKQFDRALEANDNIPESILDRINEIEGSPNAFWLQGPDEKTAYINAGGQLKNPKSWMTLTPNLRTQYINSIQIHDARQKIGSEEFMKAIIKSGISWRNALDYRMKQIGTSGIGYLADDFMKMNYGPDFFGKKNSNIRIYKNKRTKHYGIYDINQGDWVSKDGVTYDAEFTIQPLPASEDIFDDENDKIYNVNMFSGPNGAKFYTLTDLDEEGFNVYILSEKKYDELKEKLSNDGGQPDFNQDVDLGEEQY